MIELKPNTIAKGDKDMPKPVKDNNFYLSRKFFDKDEAENLAEYLEAQGVHPAQIEIEHNGLVTTTLTVECWSTLDLARYAAIIEKYPIWETL